MPLPRHRLAGACAATVATLVVTLVGARVDAQGLAEAGEPMPSPPALAAIAPVGAVSRAHAPAVGAAGPIAPWAPARPDARDRPPRPPLDGGGFTLLALGSGAGGLAGALTGLLAFVLATGPERSTDDAAGVAAIVGGFWGGSIVGTHLTGRALGLDGSWKATTIGATVGVLGGPAVIVTMPLGAAVGFTRSRTARPRG